MRTLLILTLLLAAVWPLAAQTTAVTDTFSVDIVINKVAGNRLSNEKGFFEITDTTSLKIYDCNGTMIDNVAAIPFPSIAQMTILGPENNYKTVSIRLLVVYRVDHSTGKRHAIRWDKNWDAYVRKETN